MAVAVVVGCCAVVVVGRAVVVVAVAVDTVVVSVVVVAVVVLTVVVVTVVIGTVAFEVATSALPLNDHILRKKGSRSTYGFEQVRNTASPLSSF